MQFSSSVSNYWDQKILFWLRREAIFWWEHTTKAYLLKIDHPETIKSDKSDNDSTSSGFQFIFTVLFHFTENKTKTKKK